ncbi:hypothetical protein ACXWO0_09720, partial [Streptococcus pyogenes]
YAEKACPSGALKRRIRSIGFRVLRTHRLDRRQTVLMTRAPRRNPPDLKKPRRQTGLFAL